MANGSFKFGEILLKQLKMTEQQIRDKCPFNEEFNVWITALVLTLLKKAYSKEKTLWELVEKKGKKYILDSHSKNNFDVIMAKAEEFVL